MLAAVRMGIQEKTGFFLNVNKLYVMCVLNYPG